MKKLITLLLMSAVLCLFAAYVYAAEDTVAGDHTDEDAAAEDIATVDAAVDDPAADDTAAEEAAADDPAVGDPDAEGTAADDPVSEDIAAGDPATGDPAGDGIYNVKLITDDPSVVDLRDQSEPTAPSGLKSIIRDIFGVYEPITTSTVLEDTATNTRYIVDSVASGAAGVDYEYIAAVLLFAVVLWSLFRIVGGLIK